MSLFGQRHAEEQFLEAFRTGRVHHAWLITGRAGIGKATLAWRIARFLMVGAANRRLAQANLSTVPDSLEVPAGHPIVRRMKALTEPSVRLVRRALVEKQNRLRKEITVGEVRDLKELFELSSPDGLPRIAIIDSADDMNVNAANALLKVLEEPPENSYFFLVSHKPAGLLPTIRSRCRLLNCAPLGPSDMVAALKLAGMEPGSGSGFITELAAGSVGEAVKLMAADGMRIYANIISLISGSPGFDRRAAIEIANACEGRDGTETYDVTLGLISTLLSRLARAGAFHQPDQEAASGEAAILKRLSSNLPAARIWADQFAEMSSRTAFSRLVNIDPFSVVLEILLKIDQSAARAIQH